MGRHWKNIIPWLPKLMHRFGILIVVIIAIPPVTFFAMQVRPAGGFHLMAFASRPGDNALRSDTGPELPPDAVLHLPTPDVVKGIYVNAATPANAKKFAGLVDLVGRTELNAMVVDVKDGGGNLAFAPTDPALKPHAESRPTLGDLKAFTRPLADKGIYLIARIPVFEDAAFVRAHSRHAVQSSAGGLWKSWNGSVWLDPASQLVWQYNAEIAKDAYAGGFDEVQFDYIRFPSDGPMSTMRFPFYDPSTPKWATMRDMFAYLDEELRVKNGIPTSVDLFGLTMWWTDTDMNIGQRLMDAAPHFDFISPMVYPSHYPNGYLGYANPADHPFDIIFRNMEKGEGMLASMRAASTATVRIATVRPWIQDFDMGAVYDKAMVRKEMDAAMQGGASGWLVWNAGNVYTEDAFLPSGVGSGEQGVGSR